MFEEDAELNGKFAWVLLRRLDSALALVYLPSRDAFETLVNNKQLPGSITEHQKGRSELLNLKHVWEVDLWGNGPPRTITLDRLTDRDCRLIYDRRFELFEFDSPVVIERIWPRRHAPLRTMDQIIDHDKKIDAVPPVRR